MPKVKIKTENGNEFVQNDGIVRSKPVQSTKEGKNKDKWYISIDYKDGGNLFVGPFADETTCENICINDL